jgi:hypothetical protein
MPRVVYRERPPKRGGGCAIACAFLCGLLAFASCDTRVMVGSQTLPVVNPMMVFFLGLAVLCMLSAILQKMK